MDKFKVIFSDQAVFQLRDITDYLKKTISKECAIRTAKSLQEMSQKLSMMPERFPLSRNTILKRQGYRCAVCDKYLIIYKVLSDKREVRVFAIVNGTRDYLKLIF